MTDNYEKGSLKKKPANHKFQFDFSTFEVEKENENAAKQSSSSSNAEKKTGEQTKKFHFVRKKKFRGSQKFSPVDFFPSFAKNLFFSSHVFVGKKERARVRVSCMIKEEEFLKKTRVAVAGRNARAHTHAHSEGYIRDFRARAREHALVCAHSRNASMLSLPLSLSLS